MAKRIADMTPREQALHLHSQLIGWAMETHARGGDPYRIVSSYGSVWKCATEYIDYAEGEGIGHFTIGTDEAELFLLFVAATLITWKE